MIPLDECKKGFVYAIYSRNLNFGVFDGDTGFVGIREKFGSEYLFTEYHHDTGPPFGTVRPALLIEECPIEDLAEGHSSGRYFVTNKPLFEYLQQIEAAHDHADCLVKGGLWTQERADQQRKWRQEWAEKRLAREQEQDV